MLIASEGEGIAAAAGKLRAAGSGAFKNKLQGTAGSMLPETAAAEMHRKQLEPKSGD